MTINELDKRKKDSLDSVTSKLSIYIDTIYINLYRRINNKNLNN